MTKNPISVDKNMLAAKSLAIMSDKKITSLCVHKGTNRGKTIGVLHIHNILDENIILMTRSHFIQIITLMVLIILPNIFYLQLSQ